VARNRNKATPVLTAQVATQDIVSKVTANGKIQAENKVAMSALVQRDFDRARRRRADHARGRLPAGRVGPARWPGGEGLAPGPDRVAALGMTASGA
jgi:hypothetical protein